MSVVMATFMVSLIPRASVSADRIQEVLDTDPSVVPAAEPVRGARRARPPRVRRSRLQLPGHEHAVLGDISFAIRPGETTAIVGSTGAGKTTLVNLILRLFDSTEGRVLVGGVDVRDLDPDVLWNTIGYVPQKPYLFSGTVRSNLEFGMPDATDEQMWKASRSRKPPNSSPQCPADSTPASSRAAPTCRVGSASGCRSHARSSASPTSTCSTTRSRPSTSPPTPASGPRRAVHA